AVLLKLFAVNQHVELPQRRPNDAQLVPVSPDLTPRQARIIVLPPYVVRSEVAIATHITGNRMDQVVFLLIVGLIAGVLSGMFGIGGGAVSVVGLYLFRGWGQTHAIGQSLVALLIPVVNSPRISV